MKRFMMLFLLTAVLATACCTRLHRQADGQAAVAELSAIDSLMWSQPDSAFAMLLSFAESHEVDSLDSYNEHYFHLLLAELFYKNYYTQSNRLHLLRAVDFYDSLMENVGARSQADMAFLTARAHYINGVGYYEMDSVVPACEQYMKALERMEEHFSEKELTGKKAQFMGLNYNRLAELFSLQFMQEPSIYCSQRALNYNKLEPLSIYSVSKCLYHIGIQFDKMGITDSSSFYYSEALKALPDTTNVVYRDIQTSRFYSGSNSTWDLESVCNGLKCISSLAEDSSELITRYSTIGAVYFENGIYDSAIVYLDKVFNKSVKLILRIQAAKYLKEIHQGYNNDNKVGKYDSFLSEYTVDGFDKKVEQSLLADLFQTRQLQQKEKQDEIAASKTRNRHLAFFFVMLFVVLAIVVIILKKIWSQRLNRTITRFTEVINLLLKSNMHLKEENQRLSKTKVKEVSVVTAPTKGKSDDYSRLIHATICLNLTRRFGKTDIITTNKSKVYADLAITKKEKMLFIKTVENCCPDYVRLLRESYPDLTTSDLEICRYYLIGLTDQQIAVLLQKSYSTIWRRSSKLKTLMGCSELHSHLRKVLFE